MSYRMILLLLSIIPYLSASLSRYGLIRNASIEPRSSRNTNLGPILERETCDQCLCDAFDNPTVVLFTCTQNTSTNCTCQFYHFMPKRNQIDYPQYDTNIYLIKTENKFDQDDCSDTDYLIKNIKQKLPTNETQKGISGLRSIVLGDKDTLVAVDAGTGELLKFSKSTLNPINIPGFSSLIGVGYYDKKYYLVKADKQTIQVYDEYLNTSASLADFRIGSNINTIRFLNSTQEMLVGTDLGGVFLCRKDENDEILKHCTLIPGTARGPQLRAIGVVNESAFYLGWDASGQNIHLYTRDQTGTWTTNEDDRIDHYSKIADIVVDDCQRVWVADAANDKIYLYDQKQQRAVFEVGTASLFSLLILENYTLITSHETTRGVRLTRIQPSLNCQP